MDVEGWTLRDTNQLLHDVVLGADVSVEFMFFTETVERGGGGGGEREREMKGEIELERKKEYTCNMHMYTYNVRKLPL